MQLQLCVSYKFITEIAVYIIYFCTAVACLPFSQTWSAAKKKAIYYLQQGYTCVLHINLYATNVQQDVRLACHQPGSIVASPRLVSKLVFPPDRLPTWLTLNRSGYFFNTNPWLFDFYSLHMFMHVYVCIIRLQT